MVALPRQRSSRRLAEPRRRLAHIINGAPSVTTHTARKNTVGKHPGARALLSYPGDHADGTAAYVSPPARGGSPATEEEEEVGVEEGEGPEDAHAPELRRAHHAERLAVHGGAAGLAGRRRRLCLGGE